MTLYALIVLSPLAGLAVNVAGHWVFSRFGRRERIWHNMFLGFVAGFIALAAALAVFFSDISSRRDFLAYVFLDTVAYAGFSYCYFHFVNINIASIRLRVLRDLMVAPDGLTESEVLNAYGARKIIAYRLERLTRSGNLIERGGRYFLGPRRHFLHLFCIFEYLKRALVGRGNRLLAREIP